MDIYKNRRGSTKKASLQGYDYMYFTLRKSVYPPYQEPL